MTEDGLVPIEEVEAGDLVLAYNEETGETGYYPITDVWAHLDSVIVTLVIDGETIETTPEHPFQTGEGEWVAAGDLQVGDEIRTATGHPGKVESIRFAVDPQPMYNFTVAIAHTYHVGNGQWLVHNACRSLTPADLGLEGSVSVLEASIKLDGTRATIYLDYIETASGKIDMFSALESASELARREGASELLITGSFANERFLEVMSRRYNIISEGGFEYLLIPLD